MTCVYVISDVHFGHKNICKYRTQFSCAEEHDNFILENILSTVKKRDILWILGDTCFDRSRYDFIRKIKNAVTSLNYIPGNHDTDNRYRQQVYIDMVKEDLFNYTGSMFTYKDAWLTHPPIHPKELRGKINIHGHTHNVLMDEPEYMNVCVEHTEYKPIALQEVFRRYELKIKNIVEGV